MIPETIYFTSSRRVLASMACIWFGVITYMLINRGVLIFAFHSPVPEITPRVVAAVLKADGGQQLTEMGEVSSVQ
jgi:hypothetical protein